ncbi:MAG: hypothetical protein NTX82_01260 [Candidatus Parcubacteria bacterium]|nr:hypothetical protein [Candidatus Parcubacteria bacterium]
MDKVKRTKEKHKKEILPQTAPKPKIRMFCLDGITPCNPAAHTADYCAGCGG